MYPEAAIEDAKKKEDKELQGYKDSQIDNDYVNKFLKEIDEIENINHRADKYIEDRTFETYMRRAPEGVNVPREEHKAASPIMPGTPANEPEVELNTNSFFITESPNLSHQANLQNDNSAAASRLPPTDTPGFQESQEQPQFKREGTANFGRQGIAPQQQESNHERRSSIESGLYDEH